MTKEWARAALSHPSFTGISRAHLGGLIEELAGPWSACRESALHERRGGRRKQQPGAGPKHDLVFTDRVLITLVYLRTQLPHTALAELYGLERSTITRAMGERLRQPSDGLTSVDADPDLLMTFRHRLLPSPASSTFSIRGHAAAKPLTSDDRSSQSAAGASWRTGSHSLGATNGRSPSATPSPPGPPPFSRGHHADRHR
ncbi:transposase family protein [Streptomyces sp. NBC_00199]|uniref:transposase family protein n=1 Tax=Streptomyces sp. NBC_00199 TaxID=2975678 RepID=UPI00225599A3|nr:transposase family protein [Streptomyces sp. NBC_00199]MCX5265625.1 transposase family protein [Streptomyces sp. NBC_00199]